jgi:hypothetical protein
MHPLQTLPLRETLSEYVKSSYLHAYINASALRSRYSHRLPYMKIAEARSQPSTAASPPRQQPTLAREGNGTRERQRTCCCAGSTSTCMQACQIDKTYYLSEKTRCKYAHIFLCSLLSCVRYNNVVYVLVLEARVSIMNSSL